MADVIAATALLASTGASVEQYRQAKKSAKAQKRQQEVQAGITATENRRESMRQAARARILQQRQIAQAEAMGGQASDSGTAGAVSGLSSTLAGQYGREGSARLRGNQLTSLSADMANAQSASAMAGAIGGISNSVFSVTGGSLFDDEGIFQLGQ